MNSQNPISTKTKRLIDVLTVILPIMLFTALVFTLAYNVLFGKGSDLNYLESIPFYKLLMRLL